MSFNRAPEETGDSSVAISRGVSPVSARKRVVSGRASRRRFPSERFSGKYARISENLLQDAVKRLRAPQLKSSHDAPKYLRPILRITSFMKNVLLCIAVAGHALAVSNASAVAGISIGDVAPAWQFLPGTDDKLHSSGDSQDARVTVVVFLCNKCPCARGYDARFQKLLEDYAHRGVYLVGINSNVGGIETMEAMKKRADAGDYGFPYLKDRSQKVARAFGATSTPHAFVLDHDRRIAYAGAFDDNRSAGSVKQHYVRDAIDALLENRSVSVPTSKQFGCSINFQ